MASEAKAPRLCAGCGKEVEHGHYRQNRYGEYVCGDCMRKGFKFSTRRTIVHVARRAVKLGRRLAARVVIAVLLLAALYFVMDRLTNPPAPVTEAPAP